MGYTSVCEQHCKACRYCNVHVACKASHC